VDASFVEMEGKSGSVMLRYSPEVKKEALRIFEKSGCSDHFVRETPVEFVTRHSTFNIP